jgi:hypothetical protein
MRMTGGRWWVALGGVWVVACSSPSPERTEAPPPPDRVPAGAPARPLSLADVAPGDTVALVRLIGDLMNDGDGALAGAVRRDTTLAAVGDIPPRPLTLWTLDDHLVKLTAGEVDDAGLMTAESLVWFHGGDISVVQQPFAVMLFDRDRIVLLTDEGLVPLESTEAVRMAQERAIVDSVKARLAVFGRSYPQ